MFCLTCGIDEEPREARCAECGAFLGYVAEGQGFLPQLRALEGDLLEDTVDEDASRGRLGRLLEALEALSLRWTEVESGMAALPLDETQQGVLASFMRTAQEALIRQREMVSSLDPAGGWGEEAWTALLDTQRDIMRGHEGLAFLFRQLAALAPPPEFPETPAGTEAAGVAEAAEITEATQPPG